VLTLADMQGYVILGNPLDQDLAVHLYDNAGGGVYVRVLRPREITNPIYSILSVSPQAWTLVGARHLRVATKTHEALSETDIVSSTWGLANWGQEPKFSNFRMHGRTRLRVVCIVPAKARLTLRGSGRLGAEVNTTRPAVVTMTRGSGRTIAAFLASYFLSPRLVHGRGTTNTSNTPDRKLAAVAQGGGKLQALCTASVSPPSSGALTQATGGFYITQVDGSKLLLV
jgi:hypothetical protein